MHKKANLYEYVAVYNNGITIAMKDTTAFVDVLENKQSLSQREPDQYGFT